MEEENIIELTGEDGQQFKFELLAYTKEKGETYAILYPTDGDTNVLIVKVEDIPDSDECTYTMIDDPELIDVIYNRFKESNPEGIDFQD